MATRSRSLIINKENYGYIYHTGTAVHDGTTYLCGGYLVLDSLIRLGTLI